MFISAIPAVLFSQQEDCDNIKIHEYDKINRLVKLKSYEFGEMRYYAYYSYFKDTLLLKVTHYTPENKVISELTYEYNLSDQNIRRELVTRLSEQLDFKNPGKIVYLPFTENIIDNFEFDSTGKIIFHETVDVLLKTKQTEQTFYASGKPVKEIYCNSDGGYSDTSFYEYNPDGLLIKKAVKRNESKYNYFDTYEYNSSGRLIKENHHILNSNELTAYTLCKYGSNGELLSEMNYDSKNKYKSGVTYEYGEDMLLYKTCQLFQSNEIKSK